MLEDTWTLWCSSHHVSLEETGRDLTNCSIRRTHKEQLWRTLQSLFWRCCAKISHKPGAVVFRRPYLPHFSSKSYTVWCVGFLTSWALKWYIEYKKRTSGSTQKVQKKTADAVLFASLHFACFSSLLLFASLLCLACLNDPKICQNTKTSHKYD